MQTKYKSRYLERVCTDFGFAKKKHGEEMAFLIHRRIKELQSASSIHEVVSNSIGRCHALQGNRVGEYAMNLKQPYRLVFKLQDNTIEVVTVLEIIDYH